MWDMGGDILEAGICGLISGGTMSSAGSTVNYLSNNIQDGNKAYISFEEFCNNQSTIWNNVEYFDEQTKLDIMQKTHDAMIQDGDIVKVPQKTIENVAESYPDLRGVKKKERTPILKESMNKLKENIRQFLGRFKNQNFEFVVSGKVLEARLYSTGINEVLEKITQEKANMLYSTEDIFRNSRYLYSTTDYDGDPNIYRWNYFYTPVQIGEDVVGVRIAIRDIAEGQEHKLESQIYNWGIKRDVSLDGAQPVNKDSSRDISSDTSNNNIHNGKINVKSEQTKKGVTTKSEVAPFAFENGSTKTMPQIREKDGMRIIGANKVIDENAFVEGLWEDSPNNRKSIVEKSQLESVENVDGTKYNDTGLVTYRRVQGGNENNASQKRIIVNSDGSISIPNKKSNLSISVDDGEHAKYFLNKRGFDANIVEIDVPKWFDDFLQETAIPQVNYKRNLLNQGGTAPKITDVTTPGKSFELPAPWIEWLEEYGINAKEIYF